MQHTELWLNESGLAYTADVISGAQNPTLSAQADLEAKIVGRPSPTSPQRRFETWEVTLQVNGGGLQCTTNSIPFLAPVDGYQSQLILRSEEPDSLEWSRGGGVRRKFFIKARQGRVYGVLSIQFDVHPWNGGRFIIDALLNPHGSRNLEPDPAKLITDPEEIRRLDAETAR